VADQRKYRNTQSGWAAHKRYDYSEKGEARTRRQKDTGYGKFWYEMHPSYNREKYHRVQDEAGCHARIDWYPGYRIIKALETAEVVEIKV